MNSKKINKSIAEQDVYLKMVLFRIQIKLYHFQTDSYSGHKASDQLITQFDLLSDQFWEGYQGSRNKRIRLNEPNSKLNLQNMSSDKEVKKLCENMKYVLSNEITQFITSSKDSDLFNIRDEILAAINTFLYLISFK